MDDERIERLASTPKTLAHLVVEATDAEMDAEPAPGDWSARVILAHLRDDEFLCMRRALECALAMDDPEVAFVEGADWAERRNMTRDRKDHLLADFALQRQASVAILRALRPEDWQRTLRREGRERLSVSALVDRWLAHSDEHVAQVERALGATLAEVQARRAAWAAAYPRRPLSP